MSLIVFLSSYTVATAHKFYLANNNRISCLIGIDLSEFVRESWTFTYQTVRRAIFKWGWTTFPDTRVVMLSIHVSARRLLFSRRLYNERQSSKSERFPESAISNETRRADQSQKWNAILFTSRSNSRFVSLSCLSLRPGGWKSQFNARRSSETIDWQKYRGYSSISSFTKHSRAVDIIICVTKIKKWHVRVKTKLIFSEL